MIVPKEFETHDGRVPYDEAVHWWQPAMVYWLADNPTAETMPNGCPTRDFVLHIAEKVSQQMAPRAYSDEFADAFDEAVADRIVKDLSERAEDRIEEKAMRFKWWQFGVHSLPDLGAWYLHTRRHVFALKSKRGIALYTERNRIGVRVIPLGFGWRITIREVGA